jgi:hypothetical protein
MLKKNRLSAVCPTTLTFVLVLSHCNNRITEFSDCHSRLLVWRVPFVGPVVPKYGDSNLCAVRWQSESGSLDLTLNMVGPLKATLSANKSQKKVWLAFNLVSF